MARYQIVVAAAAFAIAVASPAAAKDRPGAESLNCPARVEFSAPAQPLSPDSALEDKIDQLTQIIADLSDRLKSLEGELGDEDGDDYPDEDFTLARARGAGHTTPTHRAREHRPVAPATSSPSQVLSSGVT